MRRPPETADPGSRHDTGLDWHRVTVAVLARNDTVEAAAVRLLREPPGVDAVAAMSDELALGVLRAADRLGVPVPERLAVTGWDDTPTAAPAGLTTIVQSLREQGASCARSVIELDSDRPSPPSWHRIERSSTRAARPDGN